VDAPVPIGTGVTAGTTEVTIKIAVTTTIGGRRSLGLLRVHQRHDAAVIQGLLVMGPAGRGWPAASVLKRAKDAERAAHDDADDQDHARHAHEPRSGHWLPALGAGTGQSDSGDQDNRKRDPDEGAHRENLIIRAADGAFVSR
jgi:hypothetical protein